MQDKANSVVTRSLPVPFPWTRLVCVYLWVEILQSCEAEAEHSACENNDYTHV